MCATKSETVNQKKSVNLIADEIKCRGDGKTEIPGEKPHGAE